MMPPAVPPNTVAATAATAKWIGIAVLIAVDAWLFYEHEIKYAFGTLGLLLYQLGFSAQTSMMVSGIGAVAEHASQNSDQVKHDVHEVKADVKTMLDDPSFPGRPRSDS